MARRWAYVWALSAALWVPAAATAAVPASPAQVPAEEFMAPVPLAASVQFWTDLFLKYGQDRVVVHDRENPSRIWRVLRLPRSRHNTVDEAAGKQLVQQYTAALRLRLVRLERDTRPLDDEDRALLMAAALGDARPAAVHAALQGAAGRLRTQRGVADEFRRGVVRARPHLARMRRIFAAEGVPEDLVLLPFVESMFNPAARSAVGAVGLWQLMPKTARGLGLRVAPGHDDRRDIYKSTRAAARLLRQNYRMLGSWPLAITAYNHGGSSLRRAVQQLGSSDLVYLIEHFRLTSWGFSSKNFYAEFLATRVALRADGGLTPAAARTLVRAARPDNTKI